MAMGLYKYIREGNFEIHIANTIKRSCLKDEYTEKVSIVDYRVRCVKELEFPVTEEETFTYSSPSWGEQEGFQQEFKNIMRFRVKKGDFIVTENTIYLCRE